MPLSVVIGGQYGSEGKGKVALQIARTTGAAAVVRVGGPNSGHTGVDDDGRAWVFRQLPASVLARKAIVVLPAGSLIDPQILRREVEEFQLLPERLFIDANASVVSTDHGIQEAEHGLGTKIGSTGSGTGAALLERISRSGHHKLAKHDLFLKKYVHPSTTRLLRELLDKSHRVVIEGTQGFGLSIWQGDQYPYATSRDTTAANFVAETGLAPHDVDDVVLTIRSFPIRVGGNSGPLKNEIDWPTLAAEANLPTDYVELTSATKRVRRVARFDADVVRRAIMSNQPHRIVMNHLDYVDPLSRKTNSVTQKGLEFIAKVEFAIGRKIDLFGISPSVLVEAHRSALQTLSPCK